MRWYKESVVYQIYPRSFKDSNSDGIGDLCGIIEKVDYLKDLGVDVIWLSPIYDSPLDDNGYDISDYYNILNDYGSLDDFKVLIEKLHQREMKLIMDLVVNHTSDEHPWFKEASKDINSPYHDYYIFRKTKKKPNNWTSFFGGSAWEFNHCTNEYYLHLFSKKQPDLNWENPKVREEVKKILKFWLDLGVDGFRCDVINLLSKREGLPNGSGLPILRGKDHYVNGPKMHQYLQEIKNDVFKNYDMFTVGECVLITPEKALEYIQEGVDELNMVFQFDHMGADNYFVKWFPRKFKLKRLKKALSKWQYALEGKGWNSLYLENHDQPRSINRFGSLTHRKESAKMLATYIFFQQGTPFIYQGQEIGMTNAHFTSLEEYNDVETHNIYKVGRKVFHLSHKNMMKKIKYASRDNARTPMQWNREINGGFSNEKPWLGVNPNYSEINVEECLNDPDSILYYYKELIALRKKHPIIIYGNYQEFYENSNDIAFYERNYLNEKLVVACNFTSKIQYYNYDLNDFKLILSNYKDDLVPQRLLPYQAKVYIKKV